MIGFCEIRSLTVYFNGLNKTIYLSLLPCSPAGAYSTGSLKEISGKIQLEEVPDFLFKEKFVHVVTTDPVETAKGTRFTLVSISDFNQKKIYENKCDFTRQKK